MGEAGITGRELAGVGGGALVEAAGFAAVFWAASAAGLVSAGCAWKAMRAGPGPA